MTHAIPRLEKVLYTAQTHTIGGREGGSSRSSDGRLEVRLTPPGAKGEGTNPEQLLAAGWSSCYLSAIKIVAARMKVNLPAEFAVDAEVDLGTVGGGYSLQARFNIILPGIDRATAQQLAEGAHRQCPYSKALHSAIPIETRVSDTPAAVVGAAPR